MKTILVGGDFGIMKKSSIIEKMSELIECDVINGGTIDDLQKIKFENYDLIIWMPNVSNDIEKFYPRKKKGGVLVCSKVIREGYDDTDAVSRIFRMHANAVISIRTNKKPFVFKVIDALGNVWIDTNDIKNIIGTITDIYNFTKNSIRLESKRITNIDFDTYEYAEFIELNKLVADKSESIGGRYFGNCSTRCSKMFPSVRYNKDSVLVSRRNVDKSRLTTDDLVLCRLIKNDDSSLIEYNGMHKPSVDTPIQLSLYNEFPNINYMIHGHYYIDNAITTQHYFPCGDMIEYNELSKLMKKYNDSVGVINLKNHGFLIYSSIIDELRNIINESIFVKKEIGYEYII